MCILTVIGARPQFIKAFAVSRELGPDQEEVLVHTGQHYDEEMSSIFFEQLGIPEPDYNLGVGSNTHGRQTAAMLEGIEEVIKQENPDILSLYGDTNSTLAGAIAGSKMDPTVAHIEAGLRSYNQEMPEETNRVVADHVSDLLFAPSKSAVESLEREGITEGVHFVGDVMYDAILWAREVASRESTILKRIPVTEEEFILSTIHRVGNTDSPAKLKAITEALSNASLPVVLPIHPRTEKRLQEYDLWDQTTDAIEVIDPVGYIDFVQLLDSAERVATDSGGVQKEAFYLDTPCVTMRNETEWTETVECGWNILVGADRGAIRKALRTDEWPNTKKSPYGGGRAAKQVAEVLSHDQS